MSRMLIRGGVDASGVPLDIAIVDGALHPADGADAREFDELDATGLTVLPGLLDLQVNGAAGVDITSNPAGLWDVARALPEYGVTAFVPVVITAAPQARARALGVLAAGPPAGWTGAVPLGLHFEGPMIAEGRQGAHPPRWLTSPSPTLINGWSRDTGVLMATIAPELPGAMDVIVALIDRGVIVSVGHTEATAAQVEAAVAAGARLITHLGERHAPNAGS